MFEEVCPECQAPEYIINGHLWLDNGDIVLQSAPDHRVVFYDSQAIDPLMSGIEEIIRMPLENIIITSFRRVIRAYLEFLLPDNVNELVRSGQLDPKTLDDLFVEVAKVVGFGKYEFVDMRYEQDKDDFFTVRISEPYSVLMCVASHAGAMEALFGDNRGVTYSKVGPDVYEVTAFPTEHPEAMEGRLPRVVYEHRGGDYELERCGTCGGPAGLSDYQWIMERGVIINKLNQRRMAIQGPNEMEPVFLELEQELGEEIPTVVIEAQKRFAKTGFYSPDEVRDEGGFRKRLAINGMGNLRSLKMERQGLSMRLDNATMHLMLVGMLRGVFELAYDVDSNVEWELSEDGTLEVEVKPK